MDRRDFVKTTAAAVGGTSVLDRAVPVRAVPPLGRDPIRIGLVGCGGRVPRSTR